MTAPTHAETQRVLDKLQGVRGTEKGWKSRCPAHEDQAPSLSITEGPKMLLLHCHAGCSFLEIVTAMGLRPSDLRFRAAAVPSAERRIVATYDYAGKDGVTLFQVVRHDPKGFIQRKPDGKGGWSWKLNGVRRVLYRLPELLKADPSAQVFVAEGEKDCDNLRAIGLTATCNPMGAGKWGKLSDDSALHGRKVSILPDRDEPGRRHALDVANRLNGKAAEVRIVDLPTTLKDASDYIDARRKDGKTDAEIKADILAAVEAAPVFTPEETPAPTACDSIRLSGLADRFIREEIRPAWHREGRTVYSEKQGREVPVVSLWSCATDSWIDEVGHTAEASEFQKPPGYKARLSLFRDAVQMAAARAIRGLSEYSTVESDPTADREELLARIVAWLTTPRQLRADAVTISRSFWTWACGLRAGGGWIECYSYPVYGSMEAGEVVPRIGVRGEYLAQEMGQPHRRLFATLRSLGLVTSAVQKVTQRSVRMWCFESPVIEALERPDNESPCNRGGSPCNRVTEKTLSHARTCEKDDSVTVTRPAHVCENEVSR